MNCIGKNEKQWVTCRDQHGNLKYVITSNSERSWYYIYDNNYKKLGKAKAPTELQQKYFGEE